MTFFPHLEVLSTISIIYEAQGSGRALHSSFGGPGDAARTARRSVVKSVEPRTRTRLASRPAERVRGKSASDAWASPCFVGQAMIPSSGGDTIVPSLRLLGSFMLCCLPHGQTQMEYVCSVDQGEPLLVTILESPLI